MNKLVIANIAIFLSLLVATTLFGAQIIHLLISILPQSLNFIAINPEAGLAAIFLVSLAITFIIYLPIGLVSLYYYMKPALYPNEVKFMQNNVLLGIALFLAGTGFGLFSYLRFGVPFFLWANSLIGVTNYWNLPAFLYQMLFASMTVGLAFLLPILLTNLIRYGFVKVETLKKNRIPFALGLALIIVIIPFLPNNPIEQAIVFLPIYGLYELTIFANRKHKAETKIYTGGTC